MTAQLEEATLVENPSFFEQLQQGCCFSFGIEGSCWENPDPFDMICGDIEPMRNKKVQFEHDVVTGVRVIPKISPQEKSGLFYSHQEVMEFKAQARVEKMRELASLMAKRGHVTKFKAR